MRRDQLEHLLRAASTIVDDPNVLENAGTKPGRGLCLEPHDLVISKLVANREKDHEFARALLRENLVSHDLLLEPAAEPKSKSIDTAFSVGSTPTANSRRCVGSLSTSSSRR